MAITDLAASVNFKPLEESGLSPTEARNLVASLAPIIDLEFQEKVKSTFSNEEMAQIGKEAELKGVKPEDGPMLLEEKYFQKTGKYFMEETVDLFNDYVIRVAQMLAKAKSETQDFVDSGDDNLKSFNELVEKGNWDEAAKLFDETLKNKPQN